MLANCVVCRNHFISDSIQTPRHGWEHEFVCLKIQTERSTVFSCPSICFLFPGLHFLSMAGWHTFIARLSPSHLDLWIGRLGTKTWAAIFNFFRFKTSTAFVLPFLPWLPFAAFKRLACQACLACQSCLACPGRRPAVCHCD